MIAACDPKMIGQQFNRLEGQVHGIGRMIESGRDCGEVLQQIIAARASLEKLGRLLLETEANGCFNASAGDQVKKLERTVAQLFKLTS